MTTLGEKLREAIEKKAIHSTLNAWDEHENQIRKPQQEKQVETTATQTQDRPHFSVTNNVMRATFDAVKNAPKMRQIEYINMLECSGFKPSSTGSVLYQLIRSGQVAKDENGQLSVTRDEYTPIKAQKSKQQRVLILDKAPKQNPRQIVMVTKPRDKSEGIAALTPDTGRGFYPSAIVDNLSVLHARELYDYLKKIFGGN